MTYILLFVAFTLTMWNGIHNTVWYAKWYLNMVPKYFDKLEIKHLLKPLSCLNLEAGSA